MKPLPKDFRDWPSEAKLAQWAAYVAQDGLGIPYAERLRLAMETVREAWLKQAAVKSGAVQPSDVNHG